MGGRGRGGRKNQKKYNEEKKLSQNRFKILEEEEGHDKENQELEDSHVEKEKEDNMENRPKNNQHKEDLRSTMELDRDQEMTPSKVGTEDHDL